MARSGVRANRAPAARGGNHPDLLLKDADEEAKPEDMWNPDRSGKMKALPVRGDRAA